jgi:hypothetical protein
VSGDLAIGFQPSGARHFLPSRHSKVNVSNGDDLGHGLQRKRVLVNGGLLEVHLGACQQAVVDFRFAAIADFLIDSRFDCIRLKGSLVFRSK